MTNNEYLSQEEIDALLRQAAGEPPDGSPSIERYLTPLEQDALGEIGNISFGSAATALSTLLGRKVEITTPKVSVVRKTDLESEFPQPYVSVHVRYVAGFEGFNLLVIRTRDAHVIADLMMGGSGVQSDEPLSELQLSAVQEAMNQMMGSAATSMSTIFNRLVNISPPGVGILDLPKGVGAETIPDEDVFVKVAFRLTIGDLVDSSIMQLLPVGFAKEMVQSLLGGAREPEHAAVDPAADRPVASRPRSEPAAEPAGDVSSQRGTSGTGIPRQPPGSHHYAPPEPGPNIRRNVSVQPAQFADLSAVSHGLQVDERNLDLLMDIPLRVTVELGRTKKLIREILEFSPGSIIELDKLAGEPVDILVNNKLIARGEVVVIDENFGVRITDIISPRERMEKLK